MGSRPFQHTILSYFFTRDLDICDGQLVTIYHEPWETIVAKLKDVVVESEFSIHLQYSSYPITQGRDVIAQAQSEDR
jgi:hypothetical protein